jgi:ribosomal protein L33
VDSRSDFYSKNKNKKGEDCCDPPVFILIFRIKIRIRDSRSDFYSKNKNKKGWTEPSLEPKARAATLGSQARPFSRAAILF